MNTWRACLKAENGDNVVVKYYFTDKSTGRQWPLRVEVNNINSENRTTTVYSVVSFKQLTDAPSITVPVGYGCSRFDGARPKEGFPELVMDKTGTFYNDFRMELEVVLTSVNDDGKYDDYGTESVFGAEVVSSKNMLSVTEVGTMSVRKSNAYIFRAVIRV